VGLYKKRLSIKLFFQVMPFYKIRMQKYIISVMLIFPPVRILVKPAEMNHPFFAGEKTVIAQGCQE